MGTNRASFCDILLAIRIHVLNFIRQMIFCIAYPCCGIIAYILTNKIQGFFVPDNMFIKITLPHNNIWGQFISFYPMLEAGIISKNMMHTSAISNNTKKTNCITRINIAMKDALNKDFININKITIV
jgi:hypothetical protein